MQRTVSFVVASTPKEVDDLSNARISRIIKYIKQTSTQHISIKDFPWSNNDMSCIPELMRLCSISTVTFHDPAEYAPSTWPFSEVPLDTPLESDAVCFALYEGLAVLPPHVYDRQDVRHYTYVPKDIPNREGIVCISPDEANGVLRRLCWNKGFEGMFPSSLKREDLVSILGPKSPSYLVSTPIKGTRYMICFENVQDTGHAYVIDSQLHIWRMNGAPKNSALAGTILDTECNSSVIIVLDVLMSNDIDTCNCVGILGRLHSAKVPMDILARAWGSTIRVQKYVRASTFFTQSSLSSYKELIFTPITGVYTQGKNPLQFIWSLSGADITINELCREVSK